MRHRVQLAVAVMALALLTGGCQLSRPAVRGVFDVRRFGARGDGKAFDTSAINQAIEAASVGGGGTVRIPAGDYRCYSIHLRSNVALQLDQGATIRAAESSGAAGEKSGYDAPEPNPSDMYQDFGHTHWHNSLIWGEGLENVSIIGLGTIDGTAGLHHGRNSPHNPDWEKAAFATTLPSRARRKDGTEMPLPTTSFGYPATRDTLRAGVGNKAIALKLCRNVTVRDVSILRGGHFGILATGVDNLVVDNVKIDTIRDGMNIDCCRNVRISNCLVNSPHDDGICLKSSYALGYARATENVTINNCQVSGYEVGAVLDGTYRPFGHGAGNGRIKFGTESNGGFKNITISNCTFEHCRGFALMTVDGGTFEDVAISNITMRNVVDSPIFVRLGSRLRGPDGTKVGTIRRLSISNVTAYGATLASIISGVPGETIEEVTLSDIRVVHRGGGTSLDAALRPRENEKGYPEPGMFGQLPAYGFFVRHARGIELSNVVMSYANADARPPVVLDDVTDIRFDRVRCDHATTVPTMRLRNVHDLDVHKCQGLADKRTAIIEEGEVKGE